MESGGALWSCHLSQGKCVGYVTMWQKGKEVGRGLEFELGKGCGSVWECQMLKVLTVFLFHQRYSGHMDLALVPFNSSRNSPVLGLNLCSPTC